MSSCCPTTPSKIETLEDFPLFSFTGTCDGVVRTAATFSSHPPRLAVITVTNSAPAATGCPIVVVFTTIPTSAAVTTTITVQPGTFTVVSFANLQSITVTCSNTGTVGGCMYTLTANRLVFCVSCFTNRVCGVGAPSSLAPSVKRWQELSSGP